MRLVFSAIAALGIAFLTPAPLAAQDLASICSSLTGAAVGDWAEYEVDADNQQGTMRFAMLSEGAGGTQGQWFELSMSVNGQDMILQLMVGAWPFEPGDVKEVIVKPAGQPAMRVPDTMLGMMQSQMNIPVTDMAESCATSTLVGEESVDVPAGSFSAYHLQPADDQGASDVWVSTDIPFGLVKASGPDGSMLLLASGDDATSSITETPQDMPGMPGMGNQ